MRDSVNVCLRPGYCLSAIDEHEEDVDQYHDDDMDSDRHCEPSANRDALLQCLQSHRFH